MSKEDVKGKDGLTARKNGAWAKEKLSFIDDFIPPALAATAKKRRRFYVDLFAGPGINVDSAGDEFAGSALRALTAVADNNPALHFTSAKLVNLRKTDHFALTRRIDTLASLGQLPIRRTEIELLNGDANRLVHRVMNSIPPDAYVFAMADIEAPKQLEWNTIRALKSHGHGSVDLFVLFPLDMALNRMLSYRKETVEESAPVLTAFFGSDEWRPLVEGRITNAQSPALRRSVLDLYMSALRSLGWKHVMVGRDVKRHGDSGLYKMLYASNHPAGKNIGEWAAKKPRSKNQLDMF